MAEKKMTAEAVKRLPVGTYIERRKDDGTKAVQYIIVRSGKKKILSLIGLHEITRRIEDVEGWHFVRPERR